MGNLNGAGGIQGVLGPGRWVQRGRSYQLYSQSFRFRAIPEDQLKHVYITQQYNNNSISASNLLHGETFLYLVLDGLLETSPGLSLNRTD